MTHVSDLKDQIGIPFPRPMLYCRKCGQQSSADRGDYFAANADYVFSCCGKPMQLAVRRIVMEVSA